MCNTDLIRTIKLIESYYRIKLNDDETILLNDELKDLTYDEFIDEIKDTMLTTIEFFKISELHRILVNYKDMKMFLKRNNLNSFEELYANYEKID